MEETDYIGAFIVVVKIVGVLVTAGAGLLAVTSSKIETKTEADIPKGELDEILKRLRVRRTRFRQIAIASVIITMLAQIADLYHESEESRTKEAQMKTLIENTTEQLGKANVALKRSEEQAQLSRSNLSFTMNVYSSAQRSLLNVTSILMQVMVELPATNASFAGIINEFSNVQQKLQGKTLPFGVNTNGPWAFWVQALTNAEIRPYIPDFTKTWKVIDKTECQLSFCHASFITNTLDDILHYQFPRFSKLNSQGWVNLYAVVYYPVAKRLCLSLDFFSDAKSYWDFPMGPVGLNDLAGAEVLFSFIRQSEFPTQSLVPFKAGMEFKTTAIGITANTPLSFVPISTQIGQPVFHAKVCSLGDAMRNASFLVPYDTPLPK